jgi:hypothetical protein
VKILAELGQVLIALGFSGSVALWLGPNVYLAVALFVFVICTILLFERARAVSKMLVDQPINAFTLVISIVATSLVFGTIWPSLPPILGWSAWRHRAKDEPASSRGQSE